MLKTGLRLEDTFGIDDALKPNNAPIVDDTGASGDRVLKLTSYPAEASCPYVHTYF